MELECDVCVVGAGVGGYAAALSLLRSGKRVILTEEGDRVGGQLTAQGVPPDESPWIDSRNTGCTASYRSFRERVRRAYREDYPLSERAAADRYLNPGRGNVSPLCHEPQVGLRVLESSLWPYIASGALRFLPHLRPSSADVSGDHILSVGFSPAAAALATAAEESHRVAAPYFLDATELGDLLPLAGVEHVIGAEGWNDTGELHALSAEPNPLDQQSFSWCFAFDYDETADFVGEAPEGYEFWRSYKASFWPDLQLSWTTSDPVTLGPVRRPLFTGPMDDPEGDDLWHFRRILYRGNFVPGFLPSDVVIANWPQLDYWLGPLIGVSEEEKGMNLRKARSLSLSFLHWMRTEAPRLDGGVGYRGLRLRGDVLGTQDGLAAAPYIRESRRIDALFRVTEQHLGVEARGRAVGAEPFFDSVGVGSYRIDLHPSCAGKNYLDITNWPFRIPLGALIPQRCENLIAAGKSIGTTHITNGCFRLHPVEWNIGEAAGLLAVRCLDRRLPPRAIREREAELQDFQGLLSDRFGIPLQWPEDLAATPRVKLDPLGI